MMSFPTNLPHPLSIVSGRSVVSLQTNTFLPAHTASSCNPPLSVIIPSASFINSTISS